MLMDIRRIHKRAREVTGGVRFVPSIYRDPELRNGPKTVRERSGGILIY